MVEIRVAVADPALAHSLMRRLGSLFEPSSVTYDGTRNQIRVYAEWESRGVAAVVNTVHGWLDEYGVSSAELAVGDRSYKLVAPAS
jgi:hypothetical protein